MADADLMQGQARNRTRAAARLRHALSSARRCFRLYDVDDATAARFRARQLEALLRYTPVGMSINVVNALVVVLTAWFTGMHGPLLIWAGIVCTMAALGFRGWWRARGHSRPTASRRAFRRVNLHAGLLAFAWALMPLLLFPVPDPALQIFVGTVTTGMICAGGFALSTVPSAATLYVLILGSGAAAALARAGEAHSYGIATLLAIYCLIVIYSAWTFARTFGARMVAEARADEQSAVISLLLRDFENHTSDILWELDREGRFVHASERLESALGLKRSALRSGNALRRLRRCIGHSATERRAIWRRLRGVFSQTQPFKDEVLDLRHGDRHQSWLLSARPLFDGEGRLSGWRGVAADVTERQLAAQRLAWLAHNDTLTGLVNRARFRSSLSALLDTDPAQLPGFAIVCFDLDGFKKVNDTLGHAAGDGYLQEFGARLRACARRTDVVGRLGGDEFAMLIPGARGEEEVAAQLDRLVRVLSAPFNLAGKALVMRTSMGVALSPRDGRDVDGLLGCADLALYAAKHQGGGRYCFYRPEMAEQARRRILLEASLRDALAGQQFRLAFQPQLELPSLRIAGFEALLRWQHPEHGYIPPAEFIAIAEASGQMGDIGNWVLQQACRIAAGWSGVQSVSINVSAVQLGTDSFMQQIRQCARILDPRRVELEITESVLLESTDSAVDQLRALRDMGYRIALDDFGTGYSALTYLRRFPFDILKIDRSFVADMASNPEARIIIDTILAMARSLGMSTVAEGVETVEQAGALFARNCSMLQGYLISPPLPADAVQTFIDTWPLSARCDDLERQLSPGMRIMRAL
ncbi:putative bifunctional diguanylate cyclase/phosphodiesterase [Methyloversatilis thermotolerans]|uniref:putative bifunctional diguanylate cyclase/phosphodiesterase n=1 Tax=Methyloversatilis thermotolerans TaxID=1346290 RepID=UPI0003A53106|nr:EAL domain-containing protein [Methyloversatilis thermotolerans]